ELREVLLPEFARYAAALGTAGGFHGTQLDAADLAGNRLGQLGEFETADPFIGRQMGADMAKDGKRGVAVRRMVGRQRDKSLGNREAHRVGRWNDRWFGDGGCSISALSSSNGLIR